MKLTVSLLNVSAVPLLRETATDALTALSTGGIVQRNCVESSSVPGCIVKLVPGT